MPSRESRTSRDNGHTQYFDPDADRPVDEFKTLQCVHCGGHWECRPGSGKTRGFCMNCNGPICGPKCRECIPHEKWLEIQEGAASPTAVSVPVPAGYGAVGPSGLVVPT